MKRGVADYVLKDRVARLPAAVCKALEERYLIEDRKLAYNQLHQSEQKFRMLAGSISSAIFIFRGAECRYANRAAESITGHSRRELLELSSWDLIHPECREDFMETGLRHAPGDAPQRRYELRIITKSGEARWLDVTSTFMEVEGASGGLITAFDITERKEAEDEMRRLVVTDPLTGLANYGRLLDVFSTELERSGRTGRPFSMALFDLDELEENQRHIRPSGRKPGSFPRWASTPNPVPQSGYARSLWRRRIRDSSSGNGRRCRETPRAADSAENPVGRRGTSHLRELRRSSLPGRRKKFSGNPEDRGQRIVHDEGSKHARRQQAQGNSRRQKSHLDSPRRRCHAIQDIFVTIHFDLASKTVGYGR